MKKISNNKQGYIAAMGSIITLVLVTTIIFFMFSIHKKQQSSIAAFKDSFANTKMNDRIAFERIAGLYGKDLEFDLNDEDLMEDNILIFDDINKKFEISDVSKDFGVEPRDVLIETLDNEVNFSLANKTELMIESHLTEHYENLVDDDLDKGHGAYDVNVDFQSRPISPVDKKDTYESDDGSYHRIIFREDEIESGDYNITRGEPGVFSDYSVYSGAARVQMKIAYKEINRLVKITELDDDDNKGKIYYLKLENNSSLNKNKSAENNLLVYLLEEEDLEKLNSSQNTNRKGRDKS